MARQSLLPVRLGALLAVLFWGVSFVATKAVVAEVSPVCLIFSRTVLGAGLLVAILRARRQPLLPPRDAWRSLAVMGFVGVAFHQVLQAYALGMTSAVSAGWLVALAPIWSAVLSAAFLRERLGPAKLLGLAAGFCGAAIVVTRAGIGPHLLALPSTRGDLLLLLSTLNWALYSVLGHPTLRRIGPTRATAGALCSGGLMLLPFFVWTGAWRELGGLSPRGGFAVAFLGIACSGLGSLFWYGALEKLEASRVAAFLYLEPLVTLAAAVLLLGEPAPAVTLGGGALLLFGVWLVQRAGR